ncbi:type II secretion system protein GspG [Tahibacter amnicola]|uniref:Type II secretion system protein GspG n=1 Tax=Tahibacter amnicola TaxID=2976241 RepID=A0ABY6BS14_9GAMM|nr:type II secretion system protein GspG [Tahibacter amnicola]UXI70557.1 type II secretion system protein GspG [Tahibacter amnicola]
MSERRLEVLVEIVRGLRDKNPQLFVPDEAAFVAAVRERYPDQGATPEVLIDGYGRPFVYRKSPDLSSFRLYSLGPDGIDQNGGADDAPARGSSTTIR